MRSSSKWIFNTKAAYSLSVAKRVAVSHDSSRMSELSQLEQTLDESRLVKEDFLPRPPRTENEKEWLRNDRTAEAAHWNLLTRMRPEHLQYAT